MGFGKGKGFMPTLIAEDISYKVELGQSASAEEVSPTYIASGGQSADAEEISPTYTVTVT